MSFVLDCIFAECTFVGMLDLFGQSLKSLEPIAI